MRTTRTTLTVFLGCLALRGASASAAPAAEDRAGFLERVRQVAEAEFGVGIRQLRHEPPAVPAARPVASQATQGSGVIEFLVTGGGRGVSQSFTKSSCLFCTSYKSQAEKMAEAGARAAVEANCTERKGFLKRLPEILETNCMRVDGWMSHYVCGAQASGACQRVLDRADAQ